MTGWNSLRTTALSFIEGNHTYVPPAIEQAGRYAPGFFSAEGIKDFNVRPIAL
jgi:hypothetical protein